MTIGFSNRAISIKDSETPHCPLSRVCGDLSDNQVGCALGRDSTACAPQADFDSVEEDARATIEAIRPILEAAEVRFENLRFSQDECGSFPGSHLADFGFYGDLTSEESSPSELAERLSEEFISEGWEREPGAGINGIKSVSFRAPGRTESGFILRFSDDWVHGGASTDCYPFEEGLKDRLERELRDRLQSN